MTGPDGDYTEKDHSIIRLFYAFFVQYAQTRLIYFCGCATCKKCRSVVAS